MVTPGGRAEGLSYTYVSPPSVTGFSPNSGPTTGGTAVTITGTGVATTDQVTFNGTPAPFAVLSDTTVTATSPPSGNEGTFDVTVTGPGPGPGPGPGSNATGSFTYVSTPDI
ncbi:IPT/TIG domain-containing protein [Streptomyces decoyicus]|uniref:IPT/TIG domain-containing protein n=1 Tax=Streptomyces decoyicus TaxID=249567 RepID=UPI002E19D5EE